MKREALERIKDILGDRVHLNEPMSLHTSFRIGGPADLYAKVNNIEELRRWVELARRYAVPYFVLGHGTNILVSDQGIRGLVIENCCQAYEWRERGHRNPEGVLYAEAGASLAGLAQLTAKEGWAGLEWAVGIPSSVGGAVVNNAGAYGSSIADVLRKVTVLGPDGQIRELTADELALGYRASRFKGQGGEEVVLAAEFALWPESAAVLLARLHEYAERRRQTQPTEPNAGSIFVNPAGDFAGRLIDKAGLKGYRIGNAQISERHANFIVNLGGAKAEDVRGLIQVMQDTVRQKFGVELELEIELVGEW